MRFPALGVGLSVRLIPLVMGVFVLLTMPPSAHGAFPGANGKLAFAEERDIFTSNPDGTQATNLTGPHPPLYTREDFGPAWSPDGSKIAFAHDVGPGGFGSPHVLDIMNADGSDVTSLGVDGYDPAWSPDGQKVVFSRNLSGSCQFAFLRAGCGEELYVINVDGSGLTRLTNDSDIELQPAWAPDGTKIAFAKTALANCCDWDVYTMNPDGTGQVNISNNPDTDLEPNWSPDSAKIAFRSAKDACCIGEIYVMKRDGSGQTRLTFSDGNPFLAAADPGWSPDGTKIVFISLAGGSCGVGSGCPDEIFVMNRDGSGITRVTNNNASEAGPDWQPIQVPFPHPVGASPLYTSLVPAYAPCETSAADAQHGAPLTFPSCSNPTLRSQTVTMAPDSLGFLRVVVCAQKQIGAFCNPTGGVLPKPDVRITGSVKDVRCRASVPPGCAPGQDYNPNTAAGPYTNAGGGHVGAQPPCFPSATSSIDCLAGADLSATAELSPAAATSGGTGPYAGHAVRISDLYNCDPAALGPPCPATATSNYPATVADFQAPIPLDCLPDPSPSMGSSCGVNTTINALVPGAVVAGQAAVWQLGEVELRDSGPDGVRGNADDELFAVQGIFLP